MTIKRQRRIKVAALKGAKYAFFYIALMLLISLFGQKWAGGGFINIVTIGLLFGVILGSWELYYRKIVYLKTEQQNEIIAELQRLGFKQNPNFTDKNNLHFVRKAPEKLGFMEDIYLTQTTEGIELESIQKYVRHFKARFES